MTSAPIVFVVDDDPAIRDSLSCLIEAAGYRVQTYATAEEFLQSYDTSTPGCLVLDFRMPGMDGLKLQRHLTRETNSQIPVIMLTAHWDVPIAVEAMRDGARDFIQKPFRAQSLLESVHAAIESDRERRALLADQESVRQRLGQLTPRENEVLQLIVAGKPTKSIAAELGSSYNTVQNQRASILRKLEADSVVDVVRMVVALG